MAVTNGTNIKVEINAPSNNMNLGGGSLWRKKPLECTTILESFAVDYKNGNSIFIAQCTTGATNPDRGSTQGDLDVNRMNTAGVKQSVIRFRRPNDSAVWNGASTMKYNHMFSDYNYIKNGVKGWGHGSQIALEYAPDGTYLWVDHDCDMVDRVKNKAEGARDYFNLGTRLARVKVKDGDTFYSDEAQSAVRVKTFTLTSRIKGLLASEGAMVSIDNTNKVLGVMYFDQNKVLKVTTFSIYYKPEYINTLKMSDIVFTELTTFVAPSVRWPKSAKNGWGEKNFGNLIPNGWTIFGDYVYFFAGTAYWGATHDTGQPDWYSPTPEMVSKGCYRFNEDGSYVKETKSGNSHLMCVNWKTGEEEKFHTEIAKSLSPFREPEGMSMLPTFDNKGNVVGLELLMGIANGTPGNRTWTLTSKKDNIQNKVWSILGDSITRGVTYPNITTFHKKLQNDMGIKTVNNLGVSGTEIATSGTYANPFITRYKTIPTNSDIITIYGGVNDFLHNVPLGTPSSRNNADFYGAAHNLCVGLKKDYPKAKIFFMTPMRVRYGTFGVSSTGKNKLGNSVEQYVQALKEVCARNNMPVFDLYTHSNLNPNTESHFTKYFPDGLHPNTAGHAVMADAMRDFLVNTHWA